jgi:hypothetical protein
LQPRHWDCIGRWYLDELCVGLQHPGSNPLPDSRGVCAMSRSTASSNSGKLRLESHWGVAILGRRLGEFMPTDLAETPWHE